MTFQSGVSTNSSGQTSPVSELSSLSMSCLTTLKVSGTIPPTSPDFLTAMGRTNDATIFAGITQLFVNTSDDNAKELCLKMPSSTSDDYGKPFADIFKDYEYDFFKIDANLFSPSKVIVSNMNTGNTFTSGSIDSKLMKKSFGL